MIPTRHSLSTSLRFVVKQRQQRLCRLASSPSSVSTASLSSLSSSSSSLSSIGSTNNNNSSSSSSTNNNNNELRKDAFSTAMTSSHYEAHSAESYEDAYFSEPGHYMETLLQRTSSRLCLNHETPCRMLDIGGGTGNFAHALVDTYPSSLLVTVVDPYLDPTTSMNGSRNIANVDFVKEPAEAFLGYDPLSSSKIDTSTTNDWRRDYDKVLIKEVAHHFNPQHRVGIFHGLRQGLNTNFHNETSITKDDADLLLITRPQMEIDYPFWEEARKVWQRDQPSADDFIDDLKEAGFFNVQHTLEAYQCEIPLERWQSMIRSRFWSTFSNFSDEELEEACDRIAYDYQDRIDDYGIIRFEDRLVFISAQSK